MANLGITIFFQECCKFCATDLKCHNEEMQLLPWLMSVGSDKTKDKLKRSQPADREVSNRFLRPQNLKCM